MSYDAFLDAFYRSRTHRHFGALSSLLQSQSKKNALTKLKSIQYFHILLFV